MRPRTAIIILIIIVLIIITVFSILYIKKKDQKIDEASREVIPKEKVLTEEEIRAKEAAEIQKNIDALIEKDLSETGDVSAETRQEIVELKNVGAKQRLKEAQADSEEKAELEANRQEVETRKDEIDELNRQAEERLKNL